MTVNSPDPLFPHHRDREPTVCPHCWMVNPGPFRLCARCGADMETFLQESGGLRRTAPVQSPVPVCVADRLTLPQRIILGTFVLLLALSHAVPLAATLGGSDPGSRPDRPAAPLTHP